MIKGIVRLAIVGWIGGMVAAAVAAMSVKGRLLPTFDEGADEIVAVAIFGPLEFHSSAERFRGGRLECWYGGGVLDLRDAVLAPDGATLTVRAVFGGGQILVPPTWKVVSRVRGIGALSDVRPATLQSPDAPAAPPPELVIDGLVVFGGFAVSSELAEGEATWLEAMEAGRQPGRP